MKSRVQLCSCSKHCHFLANLMHDHVWFTKHYFTDKKDKNHLFDKKNSLKLPINKMSAILALGKELKIQLFKTSNEGEGLEQILENKSDDDIFKMCHELTGKALKKYNTEEEKRKNVKRKVQKSLHIYHLGQSTTIDSIVELIKGLVKRDYPHLGIFDGSQLLQIFVPEIWINKCPEIVGEKEYLELREGLKVSIPKFDQTKINSS